MGVKEFDYVQLKDGRKGVVADCYPSGDAFLFEIPGTEFENWPSIPYDEVERILRRPKS